RRTILAISSGPRRPVRRRPAGPRPCGSSHSPLTPLEDRQELVDLPGGDLDAILVPLLALDLDEALEGVLAEDSQHELRVRGDLDRLTQGLRQLLDAALLA